MTHPTQSAARAAAQGLGLALRAPGLLLSVLAVTVIGAAPFVMAVEGPVMDSLAVQPPVSSLAPSEVDPEWWQEFQRHASGLAATFAPMILGFAAPLESVSALLDGTRRPLAMMAPVAVSALLWAFLWGGVLHRFFSGAGSPRAFMAAGARHFRGMLAITAMAAAVSVGLYLTVHAWLFGVVYDSIASRVPSERDAFLARVILYLVFGALLVTSNAVFSFARIQVVSSQRHVLFAVAAAWALVRRELSSVLALYVIFLVIFGAAMTAYGAAELLGGARIGGWRAVAIGQAFVLFRLFLRLAFSAAQVNFATSVAPLPPAPDHASTPPA